MALMSTPSDLPDLLATVPVYPRHLEGDKLPPALRTNPLVAELLAMSVEQEVAFADRSASEAAEDGQVVAEVLASLR